MKPQSSIHLHIEELVLHGFAPGDRHGIAEAVEAELTRLFAAQKVSSAWTHNFSADRLDGGTFRMTTIAGPKSIGTQIAGAVHGGLMNAGGSNP